jgi:uncharacterized protein (DUF2237 family)
MGAKDIILAILLLCIVFLIIRKKSNFDTELNVLGTPLAKCCEDPPTGFYRDGRCVTGPSDTGTHVVCSVVSQEFLDFTGSRGNDLVTPRPESKFPGLKPGSKWCLCALRWREALEAGVAPPVVLSATSDAALKYTTREALQGKAYSESR